MAAGGAEGMTNLGTWKHGVWLLLCAGMVGGLLTVSLRRHWSRRRAGYVMTGFCLVSEISKMMAGMLPSPAGGMHLDPLDLPFHLCSLLLFAALFITFGREGRARQIAVNFLAVMGTLGSICALLIPTNGVSFTDPGAYQCFVYHGALLWFALYLIASGQAQLGRRSWLLNLLVLALLSLLMLYVNGALSGYDTNFFYLTRPPMDDLPYLNLSRGWYVYFLRLIGLGVGLVTLFHLPFMAAEARRRKSTAVMEEESTAHR